MQAHRRIDTATSRTAQWTCVSRALSSLETDPFFKSNDRIAVQLLPQPLRLLLQVPGVRTVFKRLVAPKGIYEYVIARTKYIDAVFEEALNRHFDQILILGAGFDTRALRFEDMARATKIYEVDVPLTQTAKIGQYEKRGLKVPPNLVFVALDVDRQSLGSALQEAGFEKNRRTLTVLEGLTMYLRPTAADELLTTITRLTGKGSEVVFDYVHQAVFTDPDRFHGGKQIFDTVGKAGETWRFGLAPQTVASFLATHGLALSEHLDAGQLDQLYFQAPDGRILARVNGTHCLARAVCL